jgi:hypothetical protein
MRPKNSRLFALVALVASVCAFLFHSPLAGAAVFAASTGLALSLDGAFSHTLRALAPACLPRIVPVGSACGCTLTNTSIRGLTPGELEALSTTRN